MPCPSSGCFVMTKCIRQHKVVKGGKLQKPESSLICVIKAEGSTNGLPVFTSIPAHFCIPVSLYNNIQTIGQSNTDHNIDSCFSCESKPYSIPLYCFFLFSTLLTNNSLKYLIFESSFTVIHNWWPECHIFSVIHPVDCTTSKIHWHTHTHTNQAATDTDNSQKWKFIH